MWLPKWQRKKHKKRSHTLPFLWRNAGKKNEAHPLEHPRLLWGYYYNSDMICTLSSAHWQQASKFSALRRFWVDLEKKMEINAPINTIIIIIKSYVCTVSASQSSWKSSGCSLTKQTSYYEQICMNVFGCRAIKTSERCHAEPCTRRQRRVAYVTEHARLSLSPDVNGWAAYCFRTYAFAGIWVSGLLGPKGASALWPTLTKRGAMSVWRISRDITGEKHHL